MEIYLVKSGIGKAEVDDRKEYESVACDDIFDGNRQYFASISEAKAAYNRIKINRFASPLYNNGRIYLYEFDYTVLEVAHNCEEVEDNTQEELYNAYTDAAEWDTLEVETSKEYEIAKELKEIENKLDAGYPDYDFFDSAPDTLFELIESTRNITEKYKIPEIDFSELGNIDELPCELDYYNLLSSEERKEFELRAEEEGENSGAWLWAEETGKFEELEQAWDKASDIINEYRRG